MNPLAEHQTLPSNVVLEQIFRLLAKTESNEPKDTQHGQLEHFLIGRDGVCFQTREHTESLSQHTQTCWHLHFNTNLMGKIPFCICSVIVSNILHFRGVYAAMPTEQVWLSIKVLRQKKEHDYSATDGSCSTVMAEHVSTQFNKAAKHIIACCVYCLLISVECGCLYFSPL